MLLAEIACHKNASVATVDALLVVNARQPQGLTRFVIQKARQPPRLTRFSGRKSASTARVDALFGQNGVRVRRCCGGHTRCWGETTVVAVKWVISLHLGQLEPVNYQVGLCHNWEKLDEEFAGPSELEAQGGGGQGGGEGGEGEGCEGDGEEEGA